MVMRESKRYVGTILKREYMRLILEHRKTCEMKSRKFVIKDVCDYLVLHANKSARDRGCSYNIVARLIDRVPLGPFRNGAEILVAEQRENFSTGMDEAELDLFISEKESKQVWVHRFKDATVSDEVEWDNSAGNNNCGFLLSYNEAKGRVRFSVMDGSDQDPVLRSEAPVRYE